MKKKLTLSILALSMVTTSVQAISIESGSKYPVIIEVYEWKSVCQNKGASAASKIISGAKGAYEKDGFFAAFREGVAGAVTGAGCDKVGKAVVLAKKGDSVNLPAGAMVVAYKDPLMAYAQDKKVVNPLPVITKIPASGKILLETRKSSTLGSLIGLKGDGGLKATNKK